METETETIIVTDAGCGPYEGDLSVVEKVPHVCVRRSVVDSHDRIGEMDAICTLIPMSEVPGLLREVISLRNMLPGV